MNMTTIYANEELLSHFNGILYYENYGVSDNGDYYYEDSISWGQKKNKNRKKYLSSSSQIVGGSMSGNYDPQPQFRPQYGHYDSGYSLYQADTTIPTMTTSYITTPTTQVRIQPQYLGPHNEMPLQMHFSGRRWTNDLMP